MKIYQFNSATVLIESENHGIKTKILCDPWLEGDEYLGSWSIYPPFEFKREIFDDLDFIYISHIHPDHCSSTTLKKLKKNIPVLIHNFPEKFLKEKIERLGFKVIELEHGVKTPLKENMFINILAADNCDPSICGNLMGCALLEFNYKTTQIDTMAVFDDGKHVIVNTNDCPFDIGKSTGTIIKEMYPKIDLLLVGYVAASSWPHCYEMSEYQMEQEAKLKSTKKLETTKKYIELFKPKFYLPFAGRYTLCGKNAVLNKFRGEPELEDAFEWLQKNNFEVQSKGILLNNNSFFDIDLGKNNEQYHPIDKNEKNEYIQKFLLNKKFSYENEEICTRNEIIQLSKKAYRNFEKIREKIKWNSESSLIIKTKDDEQELYLQISCNGKGINEINENTLEKIEHYMQISLDIRLLKWLLLGPHKAYWSNADLGSHLRYRRVGSTYKRGLFYCLNHFFITN